VLLLATPEVQAQEDAVVKVYAFRATRNGVGTGFFISPDGYLLTAYHVVQGANQIEIAHERLGIFSNVRVESISPEYDLARLRVLNARTDFPTLVVDQTSDFRGQLSTSGFPKSGPLQRFLLRATRETFVSSLQIQYPNGAPIFTSQGFDVIPLDVTIYSGMSGGPVIGAKGVVGILSGSYNEGGSIAWAIPTSYLRNLRTVDQPPSSTAWPPLGMSEYWRSMLAPVRINQQVGAYYDQFVRDVEVLAQSYEALFQSAQATYMSLLSYKSLLQTVAEDPSLKNDMQAANEFLGSHAQASMGSLRNFFSLSTDMNNAAQRIRVTFSSIGAWIVDESGIDDQKGWALVADLQNLKEEYQDLTGTYGIDSYLGLDTQAALQSTPRLQAALQRVGENPGLQARAYIDFLDAWIPVLQQYHSPHALIFFNRDVSKFRRALQLFEPIVYEK
jgi:hypothetical protein